MNERIKKLAEQAGFNLHNDPIDGHDHTHEIRKFAQLIVRECAGIADEYDGVGSTIVSRIEKHFGVEE